jgi:hypothetical protein
LASGLSGSSWNWGWLVVAVGASIKSGWQFRAYGDAQRELASIKELDDLLCRTRFTSRVVYCCWSSLHL